MRASRIVSAVIALAMLVLLPLAVSSVSASGASAAPAALDRAATTPVHVRAGIHKKHGHLVMSGYVQPAKGPVIIKKATHCNIATAVCNFKKYAVVHFDKRVPGKGGHYQVKVEAPAHGSWFWQAHVGKAKSRIWQTCTTTTGGCS